MKWLVLFGVLACAGAPARVVHSATDFPLPDPPPPSPIAPAAPADTRARIELASRGDVIDVRLELDGPTRERCVRWDTAPAAARCGSDRFWSVELPHTGAWVSGALVAPFVDPPPDDVVVVSRGMGTRRFASLDALRRSALIAGDVRVASESPFQIVTNAYDDAELAPLVNLLNRVVEAATVRVALPSERPSLLIERGTARPRAVPQLVGFATDRPTDQLDAPENVQLVQSLVEAWLGSAPAWLAGGLSRYLALAIVHDVPTSRLAALSELAKLYQEHRDDPPLESARAGGARAGVAGALALFCSDVELRQTGHGGLWDVTATLETLGEQSFIAALDAASAGVGQRLLARLSFRGVVDVDACLGPVGLRVAAARVPVLGDALVPRLLQIEALQSWPPVVASGSRNLRTGDRIVRIQETLLEDPAWLDWILRGLGPSDRLSVIVDRDGRRVKTWLPMLALPSSLPRRLIFYFEENDAGLTDLFPLGH